MTRRRLVALGSAIGLAATLLAMPAASVAVTAAGTGGQLAAYGATVESWGIDVRIVPVAIAEEIPDIADEYFPHTYAEMNATPHAVADGEFFDPGALIRTGPSLGNGQLYGKLPAPFNKIVIPDYPYIAHATSDTSGVHDVTAGTESPFNPEPALLPVSVPGIPALPGFGAGTAHAHADATPSASATGALASLNLGIVSVGSISGESTASQAGGVVTATTSAVLHDINIVGVLHIATETVTGAIKSSGPGNQHVSAGVTYAGVTVAGQSASIDDTGLHVGGNGVPTAVARAAIDQLNTALAQAGGSIVAAQSVTTVKDSTGTVTANVDGFSVAFADSGHDFSGMVSLGHAALIGHALLETPQPLPVLTPMTIDTTPTDLGVEPGVSLPYSAPPATSRPSRPPAKPGTSGPAQQLVSAIERHPLILPVIAGLAELSLLITLLLAGMIRWSPTKNPDDLLLL